MIFFTNRYQAISVHWEPILKGPVWKTFGTDPSLLYASSVLSLLYGLKIFYGFGLQNISKIKAAASVKSTT